MPHRRKANLTLPRRAFVRSFPFEFLWVRLGFSSLYSNLQALLAIEAWTKLFIYGAQMQVTHQYRLVKSTRGIQTKLLPFCADFLRKLHRLAAKRSPIQLGLDARGRFFG